MFQIGFLLGGIFNWRPRCSFHPTLRHIGSDIAGLLISAIQVPLSDIVGIAEASYFNLISKTTECIVDAVIS